jgi:hypothetical protein
VELQIYEGNRMLGDREQPVDSGGRHELTLLNRELGPLARTVEVELARSPRSTSPKCPPPRSRRPTRN